MGKTRKDMEWIFIRNKRGLFKLYEKLNLEKYKICYEIKRS